MLVAWASPTWPNSWTSSWIFQNSSWWAVWETLPGFPSFFLGYTNYTLQYINIRTILWWGEPPSYNQRVKVKNSCRLPWRGFRNVPSGHGLLTLRLPATCRGHWGTSRVAWTLGGNWPQLCQKNMNKSVKLEGKPWLSYTFIGNLRSALSTLNAGTAPEETWGHRGEVPIPCWKTTVLHDSRWE